jgi:hypothetical protein
LKQLLVSQIPLQQLIQDRPPTQRFFRDPQVIERQDTITGDLAFLLLPQLIQWFGGEDGFDFQALKLVVTDYVSDQWIRLDTPQLEGWGT